VHNLRDVLDGELAEFVKALRAARQQEAEQG
jgi:hypothetical protein